jgi:hypothetical protein
MFDDGLPIETISKYTGLTPKEIEKLTYEAVREHASRIRAGFPRLFVENDTFCILGQTPGNKNHKPLRHVICRLSSVFLFVCFVCFVDYFYSSPS